MEGIVIKKIADNFEVRMPKGSSYFTPRGNLKKNGIFVGDKVVVDEDKKTIEKVLKRENLLIRPPVANLHSLVIVISSLPKPDFAVVDKLLLFCYVNGIEPVICVNKIDIVTQEFLQKVERTYKDVCKIIKVSALAKTNLGELKDFLKNQISAFAGQSAVGKSAIVNAIYSKANMKVGELSKKIARGKHTTRHSELFELEENTFLADTSGFSRLDTRLLDLDQYELRYYYPDFLIHHKNCKYTSCTHTNESISDCAVKKAVQDGIIDEQRYLRYKEMFEVLKKEQESGKK